MSVLFGAQEATPVFAGVIYTGVLQVNVKVPDNAPAGGQAPLTLRFKCGGTNCDSQPNVTVALK